jgi:hypothetical protein
LAASFEAEWIRVHMPTQNEEVRPQASTEVTLRAAEPLPTPPMLWLLIPAALLALLAFLSRG